VGVAQRTGLSRPRRSLGAIWRLPHTTAFHCHATGGGEFWPGCDSASNCAVLTTPAPHDPRGHRPRRRGPDALTPRIPQRLARSLALAHLIAELHRHAGHADILREQIDGAAGMLPTADGPGSTPDGGRPTSSGSRPLRAPPGPGHDHAESSPGHPARPLALTPTDPGPLPWLPSIPPPLRDHPIWGTYPGEAIPAGRRSRRPGPRSPLPK